MRVVDLSTHAAVMQHRQQLCLMAQGVFRKHGGSALDQAQVALALRKANEALAELPALFRQFSAANDSKGEPQRA